MTISELKSGSALYPINQDSTEQSAIENHEERDSRIEELIQALQRQMKEQSNQNSESFSSLTEKNPYIIPKEHEDLFRGPLNPTLSRDYAVWRRALSISKFIFTYSSLAYQALSKGSMALGAVASAFLTQYTPFFAVSAVGAYTGYQALRHTAKAVFGEDVYQDRARLWNASNEQETYLGAYEKRLKATFGTTSMNQRFKNMLSALAYGYGASISHDIVFNQESHLWTYPAVKFYNLTREWVLPVPSALAAGGIAYFGMMIGMYMSSEALKKISDELSGFVEDISFNRTYSTLKYQSQTEYVQNLCDAIGCEDLDELQILRMNYNAQIKECMKDRGYIGAEEVVLDAHKSLEKLNKEFPEAALKPVIAQLLVLKDQKTQCITEFQNLLQQNHLAKADRFFNERLKPILLKVEFLKQVVLDPSRPELGLLSPDGSSYYSYVSLLAGMEIKESITLKNIEGLEYFFERVLNNEAAIHKSLNFERALAQVDPSYLQQIISRELRLNAQRASQMSSNENLDEHLQEA